MVFWGAESCKQKTRENPTNRPHSLYEGFTEIHQHLFQIMSPFLPACSDVYGKSIFDRKASIHRALTFCYKLINECIVLSV